MQAIIDFLMGNIVFVVIVIGFVISLFSKLGKPQNQPQPPGKRMNPMPPFGGGDPARPWRDPSRPARPLEPRNAPVPSPFQTATPARDERTVPAEEERDIVMPIPTAPSAATRPESLLMPDSIGSEKMTVASDTSASQRKVTNQELVQGVIWSEILGPPRAKKPYSGKRMS